MAGGAGSAQVRRWVAAGSARLGRHNSCSPALVLYLQLDNEVALQPPLEIVNWSN